MPMAETATTRSLTGNTPLPILQTDDLAVRPASRKKGESRFREVRDSVFSLRADRRPSSPGMLSPSSFDDVPRTPLSPPEHKPSTRRKTILECIEGWWDLGLVRGGGTIRGTTSRSGAAKQKESSAAEEPARFV